MTFSIKFDANCLTIRALRKPPKSQEYTLNHKITMSSKQCSKIFGTTYPSSPFKIHSHIQKKDCSSTLKLMAWSHWTSSLIISCLLLQHHTINSPFPGYKLNKLSINKNNPFSRAVASTLIETSFHIAYRALLILNLMGVFEKTP